MEFFIVTITDTVNGFCVVSEYTVMAYTEEEAVECAMSTYLNPPF